MLSFNLLLTTATAKTLVNIIGKFPILVAPVLNDLFDYMYFQFPNLKIVDCPFILGEFIKTGLFNNEYKQCWPFYVSYSFILRVERAKREV